MIRFYHTKLFRAIKIKEKEEKMLKEKVKLNSEKINIRERRIKALKLGLFISLLFLIIIYVIYLGYLLVIIFYKSKSLILCNCINKK